MKSYKFHLIGYQYVPSKRTRTHRVSKQNYSTLCDCQMAGILSVTNLAKHYQSVDVIELLIIEVSKTPLQIIARYTFDVSQLQDEKVDFSINYAWGEDYCRKHSISISSERQK